MRAEPLAAGGGQYRSQPAAEMRTNLLKDDFSGARIKGIALMIVAVTLFAALDAAAKVAATQIPVVEIVWFRYAVHFVIAAIVFNPYRRPDAWRMKRWGMQILRGVVLSGVTALNFVALRYLQLDQTVSIFFLAPLVVAGLSMILFGERLGAARLGAVLAGFVGILVVTRPGVAEVHPAMIASIVSMLLFSGYVLLTRWLAASESTGSMLLIIAAVPTIGLAPVLPAVWVTPDSLEIWGLLVFMGFCGGVSHLLVIIAHTYAPASVLSPFMYAQIISMVALGYIVFGDVPTPWTLAGASIVIASGLYLIQRERRVARVSLEAAS